MKTGNDRQLDIAFQIGVSKAIRNVVVNALQTYADFAFDAAYDSLVSKVGTDIEKWRVKTVEGIARMPCDLHRVERVIGKAAKDWLAPDIARVIAMMKAIADGMASIDDSFPVDEAKKETTEPPSATQGATPSQPGPATDGEPAPAEATEAKAGAGAKEPTSENEYSAYLRGWLSKATDPGEVGKRWNRESDLRDRCEVSGEQYEVLADEVSAKIKALKAKKG